MVIASIYSAEDQSQPSTPFCYRDLVRTFISSIAVYVQDYYVFISSGVDRDELFPDLPLNVHIIDIGKLFECISSQPIDVWHDFGYGNHRTLEQLRRLTGEEFLITCDFRIERLVHYADSGRPDWGSYDGIVYPSEHARNLHIDYSAPGLVNAALEIIPPSMDFNFINPLSKDDARRLLGFSQDEVLFLCISDFSPRHGTDLLPLINAFELAASARNNPRLVVSGRDLSGASLKLKNGVQNKSHSSRITLLANPDRQVMSILFAAADVYIHMPDSPLKDSPLPLLYAIGHKLAIIAARWPSSESMLDHFQSAILEPMYSHAGVFEYLSEALSRESNELCSLIISQATMFDIQVLADHLRVLKDDVAFRQTLGTAAFQQALLRHQPGTAVRAYLAFWNGLKKRSIGIAKAAEVKKLRFFESNREFANFVTQLNENCSLRLTELGEAILCGNQFTLYEDTTNMLFTPVVLEVLRCSKSVPNVNDLLDALTSVGDRRSESVLRSGILYHILLSLKRGFISRKSVTENK